MRRFFSLCLLSYIVCNAGTARAGHAPLVPEPRSILVGNGPNGRIAIGTRRGGYFISSDAGASFSWLCEAGIGYDDEEVYPGVLLSDGSLVLSTGFGGISSSRDGCDWSAWQPSAQPFVADVRVARHDPSLVLALEAHAEGAAFLNQVWQSRDGMEWEHLGDPFQPEEQALSFASDDDGRIYVATSGEDGAALLRLDAAATASERVPLAALAGARPRVIGASGAGDGAHVYVVLDYEQAEGPSSAGDVALISSDGGRSFFPLFAASADLPAGALSADGRKLALGGERDGIQLLADADSAAAGDATTQQVSELEAHALAWDDGGRLYAAGHEAEDGFSVGISSDDGQTFAPLFTLCQVQGPLSCPAETSVGAQCRASGETGWDVRKEVADSHACDEASAGAASDDASTPTSGAEGTTSRAASSGGCNMAIGGERGAAAMLALALGSLRRRPRKPPRGARW